MGKGGPFDLAEMQRLANEMFRALPGALLPGLDPDQLQSVLSPAEAQALRPDEAASPPSPDGHGDAASALSELAAGLDTPGGQAVDGTSLEHWSYLPDLARPAPLAPTPQPRSRPGGVFALTGDPIAFSELGLPGLWRDGRADPFTRSLYVVDEAMPGGATAPPSALRTDASALTAGPRDSAHPAFDAYAVRRDFPLLAQGVHGRPLVWLDNAATTQKPTAVLERLEQFYRHENSNVHRGAHALAARATDAYEQARETVARFLHASGSDEIVFVRGTTEAINLVAQAWGRRNVGPGDEIVITWLEHHSNIVPWQQLCEATGARLRVAPVDDRGQVSLDAYEQLLSDRTRLVAFTHVSNALGTITPAREMTELAHRHGARVIIDGAQAVARMPLDVALLDADWYAFSGHKVFGPTGVGVLYGKRDLLNEMPPWQGGGNMIRDVTFERTLYQPAPARFEAGTPSIGDAVGLGAGLEYLQRVGLENVARHEHELLGRATAALQQIPGLSLVGTAPERAAVISFVIDGISPEAVAAALDREGIAVRAGHHCAQPTVRRFGHEGTVRASLALYNTAEDIESLARVLKDSVSLRPPLTRGSRNS